MNFTARAFKRNIGPQPSVSAIAVDGQNIVTSLLNDRIDIRAGASNRGGYAEATGLNNSTVSTLSGDDFVRIQAHARGLSTNAWAMNNSTLNVGPGNDTIQLYASTRAGAFDPAYGALNSSITTGLGEDNLRIHARAVGNTTSTIAAYGAVNSHMNTGANNDRVDIRVNASNRNGYAEAVGLDSSTLETESGDDMVRIHAHARGLSTNAWAVKHSTLNVGPGNDWIDLHASTRAGAFDPAYGALNSSITTGLGEDNLRIHARATGNTTDTIAAYGTLNSQTNTGANKDRVEIRSTAANRRGIAEAAALDGSSLETEAGDDLIRIHAGAYGKDTQAWALRNTKVKTGPGADSLRVSANAQGNTTDTIAAYGALDSQFATGSDHDRVEIRAIANNRRGLAEAVALGSSSLDTEGGDDLIRLHAHARGEYTNAFAMSGSSLDAGSGHNSIDLKASTHAFGVDPAYGALNSSIVAAEGQDSLRISANARGKTTGTIAAYGTVNSYMNTGGNNDRVDIRAIANNRRGLAEAIGLDASELETGSGHDRVNIHAFGRGRSTNVWAMQDSSIETGSGDDHVDIIGGAQRSQIQTGDGFDTVTISGRHTNQVHIDTGANNDVLKVDGGTGITYVTGDGSDQLQLTRNYFSSLVEAGQTSKEMNQGDPLVVEDFTTGAGGDSFNCDDILLGHGVGLKRHSVFADGFLSFQQQGNDSVLFFDADGAGQQGSDAMALVVFKGIQSSDFSTENLDSRLINHDDFLLSQQTNQELNLTSDVLGAAASKAEGIGPSQPWQMGQTMDPLELHHSLQPANELV